MNDGEIKRLRNVLAELGLERTPDEVVKSDYLAGFEKVKERFEQVRPIVESVIDLGITDENEIAAKFSELSGIECTPEMGRHFMYMYYVFEYNN